jgi:hypothetical protein
MQNSPTSEPAKQMPATGNPKKRHGCLTAWLILMIVGSVATIFLNMAVNSLTEPSEKLPEWAIPVLVAAGVIEIICAIALFKWKKWGFWGICALTIIILFINLTLGVGIFAISGLIGIGILYAVLQIGGENKGWTQLE